MAINQSIPCWSVLPTRLALGSLNKDKILCLSFWVRQRLGWGCWGGSWWTPAAGLSLGTESCLPSSRAKVVNHSNNCFSEWRGFWLRVTRTGGSKLRPWGRWWFSSRTLLRAGLWCRRGRLWSRRQGTRCLGCGWCRVQGWAGWARSRMLLLWAREGRGKSFIYYGLEAVCTLFHLIIL